MLKVKNHGIDEEKITLCILFCTETELHHAFVCAVNGVICAESIRAIEKEIDNDLNHYFKDGPGEYCFTARWIADETDNQGRIENPAYWDLTKIAFYQ
jgi:hypothetical protein